MPHHEAPLPHHEAPVPAAGAHGSPDGELAEILPGITGPDGQFRHRQHINLAFIAVRRYGMPEATARICGWIQQIAPFPWSAQDSKAEGPPLGSALGSWPAARRP